MNQIEIKYAQKCSTPSDINELLPILRKYAERSETITEMGVRSIVSTWAFLAAKPKKLVSIDLYHPSFFINHDKEGCDLDLVEKLAIQENIDFTFIQGNTLNIEIEPCDFLFIDTLHDYTQLKKELEIHSKNVKKYIAFHDTETFKTIGETFASLGIEAAIEEFLTENTFWQICEKVTYNNGLIIITRNEND